MIETKADFFQENYQIRMLEENQLKRLLKMRKMNIDGEMRFSYDISGKVSMKAMFERVKMNYKELSIFLEQLSELLCEMQIYLLDSGGILLRPEHIFMEGNQYWFCCVPVALESAGDTFLRFSEFLMKEIDYEDIEAVQIASEMHRLAMSDYCSVRYVVESILKNQPEREGEETQREREETEEELWKEAKIIEYDTESSEMLIVAEKKKNYNPFQKLFRKKEEPCNQDINCV